MSRQKERKIYLPRRGENIYKRKDGRWEGRYKKGRKNNGCLKYGYIYGKTYKEVKESLYVYKLKYKELIQFQGESTSTYEEWIFNWLNYHKEHIKTSTYGTYLYKFKKYILPFLGSAPLNEITREDVQSLINYWQKNCYNQRLFRYYIRLSKNLLKKLLSRSLF